jgi:hypothetical protein
MNNAINLVQQSKDKELFIVFLNQFIDSEIKHIQKTMDNESPNIRSAALCYEAMATATLMKNYINGEVEYKEEEE